jgi:glycosyltransferase involved in cell wall biosynthesis
MRVALLTSGRFTMVDLGRELSALGHDVKVYSLVPKQLTRRFGLPDACNRWLGVRCAPFYAAVRLAPHAGPVGDFAREQLVQAIDRAVMAQIEPCDVVAGMSGIAVRALDYARRHFGARVMVERSSVHILDQRDILARLPDAKPTFSDNFRYERELVSYALADTIVVPAPHVAATFYARGFSSEQIFVNPFGTALERFQPTRAPSPGERPTILMVGTWSLQKGCDVLVEAWRKLPGTRLLHVGAVGDLPLPSDALFEHVASVPESELPQFYAQSHVLALASRQDGFGLVLTQALACGVPVVCSAMTGGSALAQWIQRPNALRVVPAQDPNALAAALSATLSELPPAGELRDLLGKNRDELSWPAWARRYERQMLKLLDSKPESAALARGVAAQG